MGDFFCGWYFRCQSETCTLAVIPAVHGSGRNRSCSIQLIAPGGSWLVPLPGRGQMLSSRPRALLGDNAFSEEGLRLNLHAPGLRAEGVLRFSGLTPLRGDIMGPFRFVPGMECRHSVVSLSHSVNGSLRINGTNHIFQSGRGYIEGDRGRAFPRHYVWTYCPLPEGGLMLSAARIPLLGMSFTGVISVLRTGGREYRLATYLGARAEHIGSGAVTLRQGGLRLTARLLEQNALPLAAPVNGGMGRTIRESLTCRARYTFESDGKILLDTESTQAAFEYEYPD